VHVGPPETNKTTNKTDTHPAHDAEKKSAGGATRWCGASLARATRTNARQGFWNGALPPIGYRIVEASEQRGHRTKKTLEIDPVQAETVRLIYRLAREGNGSSGPMGVKSIAKHLNESGIRTRDGGRWGLSAVTKVLTRTTYIGRHRFNTKFWKTRERKP